jgi:hypothetical protein
MSLPAKGRAFFREIGETMSRSISVKTRFEVFKRDAFTCQYCGAHPPAVALEVDHIEPVAEGGDDSQDNLVTACWGCNRGKGARLLSSVPKSLAERAAEATERAAQIAGYAEVMMAVRERIEADAWQVAEELRPGASNGYSRANLESIKRFVQRLGVVECLEAASIAGARRGGDAQKFRYFCGVCWRKIERLEL